MSKIFISALIALLCLPFFYFSSIAKETPIKKEHLIFWQGTQQELEVYKIYGKEAGPTVMILGGIQGDEPGGFLSADLYTDVSLKRGNLIIVPRANFNSVIQFDRGPHGDMNRKFNKNLKGDSEGRVIGVLQHLIKESDVFLNLHDGSGYYRPTWENDLANPKRYGQCIITDTDKYTHKTTGKVIEMETYALKVVEYVNRHIDNELYKFHFFNMFTVNENTSHMEQRNSATYYALTEAGIPAYGIEASKQLPSLELKIYHHNLAINAFLDLYGVEVEHPGIYLEQPVMGYLILSVNGAHPLVLGNGQTLKVSRGDIVEIIDVNCNYERGISVEIKGSGGMNDLRKPVEIKSPTTISIRKENKVFASVKVELLPDSPQGEVTQPQIVAQTRITPVKLPIAANGTPFLPEVLLVAENNQGKTPDKPSSGINSSGKTAGEPIVSAQPEVTTVSVNGIAAFLVEVDGISFEIAPGDSLAVPKGSNLKLVDIKAEDKAMPDGVVMNLRGFVAKGNELSNNGEDRGATVNTATDMMPRFSEGGKGVAYDINAELGKEVLASCTVKIVPLRLSSVTVRSNGEIKTLPIGSRTKFKVGEKVELLEVALKDGVVLTNPRFTLAGHSFSANLPQVLTMRDIAINLAVFNGDELAGKVTWTPK